jgi:hypothetical protein
MKSYQLLILKQKHRPKAVSLIEELPCLGRVAVLTRPPGGSGCAAISIVESGHLAVD